MRTSIQAPAAQPNLPPSARTQAQQRAAAQHGIEHLGAALLALRGWVGGQQAVAAHVHDWRGAAQQLEAASLAQAQQAAQRRKHSPRGAAPET